MPINSKRAKEIDAYLAAKKPFRGIQKVEIAGHMEPLQSFMIPLDYLLFNHDNRRFALEIKEYEKNVLSRELDPTIKSDAEIIHSLLLKDTPKSDEYNSEAEKLYSDLKLLGEQREVAVITHDGIVINGNRRMATLQRLHKEEPTGKWNELWVVRLPDHVSDKDLWKIEAGLQLSKEKVADYGPVNNLLMIREGKKAGLQPDEIAASMYGWTEKQVQSDLERLDIIDTFLDFFGQPGNYGLIKTFRLSEHFIDIQRGLVQKMKDAGATKKEIAKSLTTAFVFLRGSITKPDVLGLTHMDVRNICKILQDARSTEALTHSFDKTRDVKSISVEKLAENFDRASDVRKNSEDAKKPGKLIDRAITALNGIDRKTSHFKQDADVKVKLKTLDSLIKEMKSELGI